MFSPQTGTPGYGLLPFPPDRERKGGGEAAQGGAAMRIYVPGCRQLSPGPEAENPQCRSCLQCQVQMQILGLLDPLSWNLWGQDWKSAFLQGLGDMTVLFGGMSCEWHPQGKQGRDATPWNKAIPLTEILYCAGITDFPSLFL